MMSSSGIPIASGFKRAKSKENEANIVRRIVERVPLRHPLCRCHRHIHTHPLMVGPPSKLDRIDRRLVSLLHGAPEEGHSRKSCYVIVLRVRAKGKVRHSGESVVRLLPTND
jgi:hypothetical protein